MRQNRTVATEFRIKPLSSGSTKLDSTPAGGCSAGRVLRMLGGILASSLGVRVWRLAILV